MSPEIKHLYYIFTHYETTQHADYIEYIKNKTPERLKIKHNRATKSFIITDTDSYSPFYSFGFMVQNFIKQWDAKYYKL